jgi:hypothetical protein
MGSDMHVNVKSNYGVLPRNLVNQDKLITYYVQNDVLCSEEALTLHELVEYFTYNTQRMYEAHELKSWLSSPIYFYSTSKDKPLHA